MTHTPWVPHVIHHTSHTSHHIISSTNISPLTTLFHRPTTTHDTFSCVRIKQRREWRKGSQDGHHKWAPAHLPRAPALPPLPPINGHLLSPSSHKHSRKPHKFQFQKELL